MLCCFVVLLFCLFDVLLFVCVCLFVCLIGRLVAYCFIVVLC